MFACSKLFLWLDGQEKKTLWSFYGIKIIRKKGIVPWRKQNESLKRDTEGFCEEEKPTKIYKMWQILHSQKHDRWILYSYDQIKCKYMYKHRDK